MNDSAHPSRIDNLLILRGLCAFGVLLIHTIDISNPWFIENGFYIKPYLQDTDLGIIISDILWPLNAVNFVLIFFALSGYLMGKIYLLGRYELSRKGTYHFYKNRFLRIAPLFYFNLLILMALAGDWSYFIGVNWTNLLGDIFFINNLTPVKLNFVTWSISYEMQYYLLCPLLFWFFYRYSKHNFIPLLISIFAMGAYAYWASSQQKNSFAKIFAHTWIFMSGFLANYLILFLHKKLNLKCNLFFRLLGFLSFAAASVSYWVLRNDGHPFLAQVSLCAFAVLSIVLLELPMHANHSRITKTVGIPLTWLGQISYGVYLWHYPIIKSIMHNPDYLGFYVMTYSQNAHGAFPAWLVANLMLLGLVVIYTLTLSTITFFLVEQKFRPGLYKK